MAALPVIIQDRRKVSALATTLQVHVLQNDIMCSRFLYFIILFTDVGGDLTDNISYV
jgi:hypothetical protein